MYDVLCSHHKYQATGLFDNKNIAFLIIPLSADLGLGNHWSVLVHIILLPLSKCIQMESYYM